MLQNCSGCLILSLRNCCNVIWIGTSLRIKEDKTYSQRIKWLVTRIMKLFAHGFKMDSYDVKGLQ